MGICLDTEQNQQQQSNAWPEETVSTAAGDFRYMMKTPADGRFPMQNVSSVRFETPKVPVIFVLGGPGSGKVTHCDNFMHEKRGIVHINMTDLLQQYAIGNEMQDFSQLSSRTVTEVLMLEMKMAPEAKTYLISGYPRSMRDVVEYSEKIQIVNGVILISWRQKILERQIDYGAKLGQVVLSLARMELDNFFKNVMPVADYFDQSNMLIAVNGERHPAEVYRDFHTAIIRILGQQEVPPVFNEEVPGKVQVPTDVSTEQMPIKYTQKQEVAPTARPTTKEVITVTSRELEQNYSSPVKPGWPTVLWVIGGPGSNKAALCAQVIKRVPSTGTWSHISVGRLLRAAAEQSNNNNNNGGAGGGSHDETASVIRRCIVDGELVPLDVVMRLVESHMAATSVTSSVGVIVDGFPRNVQQANEFENKFKQRPLLILLDCSKLQLGRGRPDDSVSAFRRRLEIFREHTLPMLKTMDNVGRLTIVDGDTDTLPVQEDFNNIVKQHITQLETQQNRSNNNNNNTNNNKTSKLNGYGPTTTTKLNGHIPNDNGNATMTVDDLENDHHHNNQQNELDTVSRRVQRMQHQNSNGHVPNGVAIGNGFVNNTKYGADYKQIRSVYQTAVAAATATTNTNN